MNAPIGEQVFTFPPPAGEMPVDAFSPEEFTIRDRFRNACIGAFLVENAFIGEVNEQWAESDGVKEKAGLIASGGLALAAQAWDRLRGAEIIGIPMAVSVYKDTKSPLAAGLFLTASTDVQQMVIGSSWGNAMLKFPDTTDTFDQFFPIYSDALKEDRGDGLKGYAKTLYKQGVLGIGTGNTPFVTAEVIDNKNPALSDVLDISQRTSRRVGVAVGSLAFGLLTLKEQVPDNDIVDGVINWAQKPAFWVAMGLVPFTVKAAYIAAKNRFKRDK